VGRQTLLNQLHDYISGVSFYRPNVDLGRIMNTLVTVFLL